MTTEKKNAAEQNWRCCSTVEQVSWKKGGQGIRDELADGWKISQVEALVGLPRRDIQRACYEGAGGSWHRASPEHRLGLAHVRNARYGKALLVGAGA